MCQNNQKRAKATQNEAQNDLKQLKTSQNNKKRAKATQNETQTIPKQPKRTKTIQNDPK